MAIGSRANLLLRRRSSQATCEGPLVQTADSLPDRLTGTDKQNDEQSDAHSDPPLQTSHLIAAHAMD